MTAARIRASDADRQRVVEILQEQTAEGRLTIQEFEHRIDAAYLATTWQELTKLTEDLPVQASFQRAEQATADRLLAAEDRVPLPATDRWSPDHEHPWRRLLVCCCGWTATRPDA